MSKNIRNRSLLALWICMGMMTFNPIFAGNHGISHHGDEYTADYIVIGVGTSGSTVCRLLTDDMKTSVLALEAGGNHNNDPDIKFTRNTPLSVFFDKVEYYWPGTTIPQSGLDNRSVDWSGGRLLGGGSSVNATVYLRATDHYFDQFAQIAGPRWNAENILHITKKLENFSGVPGFFSQAAHGEGGLIDIRQAPTNPAQEVNNLAHALQDALLNPPIGSGLNPLPVLYTDQNPINVDFNDPAYPITISSRLEYFQDGPDGSLRVSAATAMLNNSIMTPNGYGIGNRKLRVLLKSTALKILFDDKTAKGVEFLMHGKRARAHARKGVILCAGIHSASLLQVSGIGPRNLLESFNIPVVFDSPNVGVGVKDATALIILLASNNTFVRPDPNANIDLNAFLPTPGQDPTVRGLHVVMRGFEAGDGVLPPGIDPLQVTVLTLVQSAPQSSGQITIQSNDPLQIAKVDLGILSEQADVDFYINVLRNYIQPFLTNLNLLGYQAINDPTPFLNDPVLLTQYIRSQVDIASPVFNFTGMTRMGPLEQGAVVDSYGRVYGAKNLFVADNSVAPIITDAGCCTLAFQIGYNIAKGILELER